MKLDLKTVEYFGHKITVPNDVTWLAIDADGELIGYNEEPVSNGDYWLVRAADFGDFYSFGYAYLQGMDWKDTKVKV